MKLDKPIRSHLLVASNSSRWKKVALSLAFLLTLYGMQLDIDAFAQQPPAWRSGQFSPRLESLASIRIVLRSNVESDKNILQLSDLADMDGSESLMRMIRDVPIGPAPAAGNRQTWSQNDILELLQLRGLDPKCIRWGGSELCQVVRSIPSATIPKSNPIQLASAEQVSQSSVLAERTVGEFIAKYLRTKSPDAASWTIYPRVPSEHGRTLSQRKLIRGISGGTEPWTGEQNFQVQIETPHGVKSIDIIATVQLPLMVWGASGPLAKGLVLDDRDLKLVRLTSSMKATEEACFDNVEGLIGKELRRSISTGQPIQRLDIGPPRIVHAHDLVEIHVAAGAMIAQTAGRALQSGGLDEIIEVEVIGTRKKLAVRIRTGNIVEVIAR